MILCLPRGLGVDIIGCDFVTLEMKVLSEAADDAFGPRVRNVDEGSFDPGALWSLVQYYKLTKSLLG